MSLEELTLGALAALLLAWALRRWIASSSGRRALRELGIRLGLRRITPRRGERLPGRLVVVPALDTGGGFRPKHRPQDPAKDPREPYDGESGSRGSDHGWSNCTMSSGADAISGATGGRLTPWGGDMRHRQGDLEGGTDLYDLRDAFAAYGERLTIKSGSGWSALKSSRADGRYIVIQGTGEVPGAGDFDGGHACVISPETHADGRWLFGDPLATDWQWIEPGAIRSWAERWQSSIAYAVTDLPPDPEPEPPEPEPPDTGGPPDPTPYGPEDVRAMVADWLELIVPASITAAGDELVRLWLAWMRAPAAGPSDAWERGAWADPGLELEELLEGDEPEPCEPYAPARWSRGMVPFPAWAAIAALASPAAWDGSSWPGALWRAADTPSRESWAPGAFYAG